MTVDEDTDTAPAAHDPAGVTIQWAGHATVVIRVGDRVVVTDPALTRRLAHLVRRHPAPPIDHVDRVLISHMHADHLHPASLSLLRPTDGYVVPAGAEPFVPAGSPVQGVRAGDRLDVGDTTDGIEVEAVRAVHDHRRGPHSRARAEPLGYVLRTRGRTIYFAGDTGLFEEMADIGQVDVALLPIGGWGRRIPPGHLTPLLAARAAQLLSARIVVPIHWGTYAPAWTRTTAVWPDSPLPAFTAAMGVSGLAGAIRPLAIGQTLCVD